MRDLNSLNIEYDRRSFQQQPRQQISNLQPTFEDLSIDDKLSELQRLIRYSRSAIGLQRYDSITSDIHHLTILHDKAI